MKILPNITPETKFLDKFKNHIRHMSWVKDITFDDIKYLYDKGYNHETAAIIYIADRYNKWENENYTK